MEEMHSSYKRVCGSERETVYRHKRETGMYAWVKGPPWQG